MADSALLGVLLYSSGVLGYVVGPALPELDGPADDGPDDDDGVAEVAVVGEVGVGVLGVDSCVSTDDSGIDDCPLSVGEGCEVVPDVCIATTSDGFGTATPAVVVAHPATKAAVANTPANSAGFLEFIHSSFLPVFPRPATQRRYQGSRAVRRR